MYQYPLYRPPSEANSLTIGCSYNKCSFCSMYKGKKFIIKPLVQIKKEIDLFREEYKKVEKIFLADGDALIIPMVELKLKTNIGRRYKINRKIFFKGFEKWGFIN